MGEQRGEPDWLRSYLVDRDVPCPQCGYNLRNLTACICPECGDRLTLRVNLAEPRQAAPICGLIGLSAGGGLNGLLLIYGIIVFYRFSPDGLGGFFGVNGVGAVVMAALVLAWLRAWRWLRRQNDSTRWLLAGACWGLALLDVILLAALIR